ncbi:hypothetical protein ACFC58_03200 [Kitasatospora purpeofusca]|uniref:hypothetical protein n=1 Tax=Kitasatospora purpeofusca TaxID=67352 RepID=UPI0035DF13AF
MEPIITVDDVARRLGYETPLAADVRARIETVIEDAQDALVAHLGRPLLPQEHTESGVHAGPEGWELNHGPVITVLSATLDTNPLPGPYATPTYTVRYLAGIDARSAPDTAPLRLWLRSTAGLHPLLADAPLRKRRISSASVEGQSVSYDTSAEPPVLLAPPDLATTDRWRLRGRRVYQPPVRPTPPGLTNRGLPGAGWP